MTPVARLRLDEKYPQTSAVEVTFEDAPAVTPHAVLVKWTSEDVHAALRQMFCVAPHEHLVSIELSTVGITACIRREAPPARKGRTR